MGTNEQDYGDQFRQIYDEMEAFCERNRALFEVKLVQEFEAQQREMEAEAEARGTESEPEPEAESSESEEVVAELVSPAPRAHAPALVRDPSLTCVDSLSSAVLAERKAVLRDSVPAAASHTPPKPKPTLLSVDTGGPTLIHFRKR